MIVGWLEEAETAELRALEYWERGVRCGTELQARVIFELAKRDAAPHSTRGQVPGLSGAKAAMRREASERRIE